MAVLSGTSPASLETMGYFETWTCKVPIAFSLPTSSAMRLATHRASSGMIVMQVALAVGLLGMVMVGTTQAFLVAHRNSAEMRLLTAARAIVQRNIDEALSVGFTSTDEPTILAVTSGAGVTYDDDGSGDNTIKVATQDNGTTVTTKGTMTRVVTPVTNSDGAIIRKVFFNLAYTYRGRARSTQMTTMRAIDD